MTDTNNNDMNDLEESLKVNTTIESLKKHSDLDKAIETFSNSEDRLYLKKFIRENGIDGNQDLETDFKLTLIAGDICEKANKIRIEHIKQLENASTDLISASLNSLEEFKDKILKELNDNLQTYITDSNNQNIVNVERLADLQNEGKVVYQNLLTSTISISNVITDLHSKSADKILKEVGSSHELTEKVATEMALRVLDKNAKAFEKRMADILRTHKSEYDKSVGRFNIQKIKEHIIIMSASMFIAGVGLIAAYQYIVDFI
ncbi:hypothetical protein [Methylovorus glucosotrophus]|uniref:Uncharacterized protein n=1 Tax=Methylovorus glucosotrophus (strain SIP3-4) TaxID=582744 RepID=C6X7V6_METGS|nr:hypothetical protein [Methylovorus glucosotrophus]ACT51283.1 hypothetical protein Msip34_2041 [Methylovorus glucosotrophus SIP3-4]